MVSLKYERTLTILEALSAVILLAINSITLKLPRSLPSSLLTYLWLLFSSCLLTSSRCYFLQYILFICCNTFWLTLFSIYVFFCGKFTVILYFCCHSELNTLFSVCFNYLSCATVFIFQLSEKLIQEHP